MIFGIHPEDRDRRNVVLRSNALGELKSSQCFQQREQRSAEEPSLLPGHDGHEAGSPRTAADAWAMQARRGVVAAREAPGHGVALPRVVTGARRWRLATRRVARIAGKEVGQARVVERIVRGEPSDPREATNIDGKTTARGRVPAVRNTGDVAVKPVWDCTFRVFLQSVARSVKKTGCECYDRSIP